MSREDRLGARERLARRAVAQLEDVAEQDEPVDAVAGARAARARGPRRRSTSAPRAPAEVQVGDDERGHGARGYAARPWRTGALDGLLVADFSRVLAGPLATMTLADLGADVIKVERPDGGDDTRGWGPPWTEEGATYYLGLNRGKRSVALDLADPEGVALARALAARADVVVESFRAGHDGDARARLRRPSRGQPARRLLLDHRVRDRRAAARCRATTCCCRRWAAS